jgi:hypothetical protein
LKTEEQASAAAVAAAAFGSIPITFARGQRSRIARAFAPQPQPTSRIVADSFSRRTSRPRSS